MLNEAPIRSSVPSVLIIYINRQGLRYTLLLILDLFIFIVQPQAFGPII